VGASVGVSVGVSEGASHLGQFGVEGALVGWGVGELVGSSVALAFLLLGGEEQQLDHSSVSVYQQLQHHRQQA
jgi:hypothetical protein